MKKRIPYSIVNTATEIGKNIATWRKMFNMTQAELAERCQVSRETISRLENGDGSVSLNTVLVVVQKFGILEKIEESTNPYATPFGMARAEEVLGQRVKRKKAGGQL